MRFVLPLFLAISPALALAGTEEALNDHILPGYQAFADATAALDESARSDCGADALRPAYNAAFDAWLGVSHLHLGPAEDHGRSLTIAFWPDPKGLTLRKLKELIATQDLSALEAQQFANQSVAVRGLFALERLSYDPELAGGDYACALRRAVAHDLARIAAQMRDEWRAGAGEILLNPDVEGSPYLDHQEVTQALFTQLITGLEYDADQRIGRPLGTFDRPRPERAEARLSARSLRNVELSLLALRDLAVSLAPDSPKTLAAFDHAIKTAEALNDPDFAGVSEPGTRLKVEILGQQIKAIKDAALTEMGASLGVGVGFNAGDGD